MLDIRCYAEIPELIGQSSWALLEGGAGARGRGRVQPPGHPGGRGQVVRGRRGVEAERDHEHHGGGQRGGGGGHRGGGGAPTQARWGSAQAVGLVLL